MALRVKVQHPISHVSSKFLVRRSSIATYDERNIEVGAERRMSLPDNHTRDSTKVATKSVLSVVQVQPASISKRTKSIHATYTYDYNIVETDLLIRGQFLYMKSKLNKYKEKRHILNCIIEDASDDAELSDAREQLSKVKSNIVSVTTGKTEQYYIEDTNRLVLAYMHLQSQSSDIVFSRTNTDVNRIKRLKIIQAYLNVASRYFDINVTQTLETSIVSCNKCDFIFDTTDSTAITGSASRVRDMMEHCPSCYTLLDDKYESVVDKSDKTQRKDTFDHTMLCYQAQQNRTFSPEMDKIVKGNLRRLNIDPKSVTKPLLTKIFKHHKLSSWYEDINLYHYTLTGVEPPNISQYEDLLRTKNNLIKQVNKEIEMQEGIKYCLHGPFTLKVLLKSESIPYNDEDFPSFLKTTDVIDKHNNNMRRIFDMLREQFPDMKWDYYHTI